MHVAGEASGQQGQQVPTHSDVWGDPRLDSDFRLRDPALPQVNVLGPSPGCGPHGRGLSTATRGRGSPACGARPPGTPPGPRARPPVRFPRSTPAPGPEAARRRRELRAQDALRAALTRGARPAGSGRGAYWGVCEPQPQRDGTALPSGPRASGTGNPSSLRAGAVWGPGAGPASRFRAPIGCVRKRRANPHRPSRPPLGLLPLPGHALPRTPGVARAPRSRWRSTRESPGESTGVLPWSCPSPVALLGLRSPRSTAPARDPWATRAEASRRLPQRGPPARSPP